MTLEQLEQRVTALEEAFEEMRREQRAFEPPPGPARKTEGEDDLIPGTEYPLTLHPVPPQIVIRLQGKIRQVRRGREDLGLSVAEWDALQLGESDE